MRNLQTPATSFGHSQIASFRLTRHHLAHRSQVDLIRVCSDVCGIQAQSMPAAEIALWARIPGLKLQQVRSALFEEKALLRTSCMRQTLHLIPAEELPIYIAALKKSRMDALWRILSKFDITPNDLDRLNDVVLKALKDGPRPQRDLKEQIRPLVGASVRKWMARVWNPFRPALVAGLVCYGPKQGQEVTLVRVDQWLPEPKAAEEAEAKRLVLRRYLKAFAPASLRDFTKWSGIPSREAKEVWESLSGVMTGITTESGEASVLREDLEPLQMSEPVESRAQLLPGFDPYLLGHADTRHLVTESQYKKVYRKQWWISATVLIEGRVAGIWSSVRRGNRMYILVKPFGRLPKPRRSEIEEESSSLARFLETDYELKIAAS